MVNILPTFQSFEFSIIIHSSQLKLPPEGIGPGTSSVLLLTELTWQMLIEGYLTSLLFVPHMTFGLR